MIIIIKIITTSSRPLHAGADFVQSLNCIGCNVGATWDALCESESLRPPAPPPTCPQI